MQTGVSRSPAVLCICRAARSVAWGVGPPALKDVFARQTNISDGRSNLSRKCAFYGVRCWDLLTAHASDSVFRSL